MSPGARGTPNLIPCIHVKLVVSHADDHLFHLAIVSEQFSSTTLCPGCSTCPQLQLGLTSYRFCGHRSVSARSSRLRRGCTRALSTVFQNTDRSRQNREVSLLSSNRPRFSREAVSFNLGITHSERRCHSEIMPPCQPRVSMVFVSQATLDTRIHLEGGRGSRTKARMENQDSTIRIL